MLEKVQTIERIYENRPNRAIDPSIIHPPTTNKPPPPRLDSRLVWHRCDALRFVVLKADGSRFPGKSRLALQVDVDALGLGLLPLRSILLDALDEIFSGSGVSHMLNANVDALLDVSVADLLVAALRLDAKR